MEYIPLITAMLGSSVITGFISTWINRKKPQAEAAQILNQATLEWATSLKSDIATLKEEVAKLTKENTELRTLIIELTTKLSQAGVQVTVMKERE